MVNPFLYGFGCSPTFKNILSECETTVMLLLQGPLMPFKFGICNDPEARFNNPSFGYSMLGVFKMILLHKSTRDADEARQLERELIHIFGHSRACKNIAPGGEGMSPHSPLPVFTYVVVGGNLDNGGAAQKEFKHLMQCQLLSRRPRQRS
jgi:hypothetical protein